MDTCTRVRPTEYFKNSITPRSFLKETVSSLSPPSAKVKTRVEHQRNLIFVVVVVVVGVVVRSVAANSYDQIYCMQLAQNAVHGAMAGYTAFSVGMVNDRTVRAKLGI